MAKCSICFVGYTLNICFSVKGWCARNFVSVYFPYDFTYMLMVKGFSFSQKCLSMYSLGELG